MITREPAGFLLVSSEPAPLYSVTRLHFGFGVNTGKAGMGLMGMICPLLTGPKSLLFGS